MQPVRSNGGPNFPLNSLVMAAIYCIVQMWYLYVDEHKMNEFLCDNAMNPFGRKSEQQPISVNNIARDLFDLSFTPRNGYY